MIETIKHNFRVEVFWESYHYSTGTRREAQDLVDTVKQLRGVDAMVVWDVHFQCTNCGAKADTREMLAGCCEENPE